MRKITTLFFVFMFAQILTFAQQPFPVFTDFPQWNVQESKIEYANGTQYWDSKTFKLKFINTVQICGENYAKTNDSLYIRNDGQKVYARKSSDCNAPEYLVYDFGMQIGDSFSVEVSKPNGPVDTLTYYLRSIDIENYFGVNKNVLLFEVKSSNPFIGENFLVDKWIEGLGSITHPFYFNNGLFSLAYNDHYQNKLLCFYQNDVQLFQNPSSSVCQVTTSLEEQSISKGFSIIQNPFQDQIKLTNNSGKNFQFELYNFSGQKIEFSISQNGINTRLTPTQNLASGIYLMRVFENGKQISTEKLIKN